MANRQFFNNFLKKDEMFQTTQNNSILKRTYWGPKFLKTARVRMTDRHFNSIPLAHNYSQLVQYYPGNIPYINRKRTRLPAGEARHRYYIMQQRIHPSEEEYLEKHIKTKIGKRPAPADVLPNPFVAGNPNRIRTNRKAMLSVNQFYVDEGTQGKPNSYVEDYWHPDYQGDFEFATANSIQPPTPLNNSNFIPKNFLSNKQKESFVWLSVSPALYAM